MKEALYRAQQNKIKPKILQDFLFLSIDERILLSRIVTILDNWEYLGKFNLRLRRKEMHSIMRTLSKKFAAGEFPLNFADFTSADLRCISDHPIEDEIKEYLNAASKWLDNKDKNPVEQRREDYYQRVIKGMPEI